MWWTKGSVWSLPGTQWTQWRVALTRHPLMFGLWAWAAWGLFSALASQVLDISRCTCELSQTFEANHHIHVLET